MMIKTCLLSSGDGVYITSRGVIWLYERDVQNCHPYRFKRYAESSSDVTLKGVSLA